MIKTLTQYASLAVTPSHVHIEFSRTHQVMSSAVLNGGLVQANHLVNMKVPKTSTYITSPEMTLIKYSANSGWDGTVVGMMTAASMDSFRLTQKSEQGIDMAVLVTSGLSNPRRVGDFAEHRSMTTSSTKVGTINIVILTSAALTEAACVEALLIATEAKSAALQEVGIESPISNMLATGTGTDSMAIVNGHGPEIVNYCGKHVLYGEILGRMVIDTVKSSIDWKPKLL